MKTILFIIVLIAAAFTVGCSSSEAEARYFARKTLLERQNQGLRELIVEAEQGTLLPPDRFLIGVDEKLAGDLFHAHLPLEIPLGEQFIIRLERADISFQAKYGAIAISGFLYPAGNPQNRVDVRVLGGLGAAEIDPERDVLNIRIAIDHIDLVEAAGLEDLLGRGVMLFLAAQGREFLENSLPVLEIPVLLEEGIPIPAIQEGGIHLDALTVPLNLSVESVLAAGGKLWVRLHAEVGTVAGAAGEVGIEVEKPRPTKKEPQL